MLEREISIVSMKSIGLPSCRNIKPGQSRKFGIVSDDDSDQAGIGSVTGRGMELAIRKMWLLHSCEVQAVLGCRSKGMACSISH